MATFATIAVRSTRSALALAAAIMLLVPVPARCASCATGSDRCAKCAHVSESLRDSDGTNPVRSCCQRHSASNSPQNSSATTASVDQTTHTCGCGFSQAPRTAPAVEKISFSPQSLTGLAVAAEVLAAPSAGTNLVRELSLAAPPPIPHRILHCSWIV